MIIRLDNNLLFGDNKAGDNNHLVLGDNKAGDNNHLSL